MKILSTDLKKKKTILCGNLVGDTFYKEVSPRHFMKVVGGYGINEDAFETLLEHRCLQVKIKEIYSKTEWTSKIMDWLEHSVVADYGSGKQRFLSLKYMHKK